MGDRYSHRQQPNAMRPALPAPPFTAILQQAGRQDTSDIIILQNKKKHDTGTHLRRGRPGNHARGGVLDLHLVQEDVAVLGQLDLSCAADQHLERAAGAEVGLEDVLEAAGGGHVDRPGLVLADDLGVGGELLQSGRHGCWGWLATTGWPILCNF